MIEVLLFALCLKTFDTFDQIYLGFFIGLASWWLVVFKFERYIEAARKKIEDIVQIIGVLILFVLSWVGLIDLDFSNLWNRTVYTQGLEFVMNPPYIHTL